MGSNPAAPILEPQLSPEPAVHPAGSGDQYLFSTQGLRRVITPKRSSQRFTRRRNRGGTSLSSAPSSWAAIRCMARTSTLQRPSASRISRAQVRLTCQLERLWCRGSPGGGGSAMWWARIPSRRFRQLGGLEAGWPETAGGTSANRSKSKRAPSQSTKRGQAASSGCTVKDRAAASRSLRRRLQAPRTGSFHRKPASLACWRSL